ncbi:RidA family protein [Streptomyces noursei]|uniref:RidA family protein n=1 Tax=Streptomyces noursei TaxID=1971 RepID=UPI003802D930
MALDCQPRWRGRGLPAPGRALRLRPAPHGHRRGTAEAGCPPRPGRGSAVLNRGAGGRPAARRARRHWRLRRTRRRPPARGRCPVLYVVDLRQNAAATAVGNLAYFGDHRPASTVLGVTELTFPGQVIEISYVVDTKLPA